MRRMRTTWVSRRERERERHDHSNAAAVTQTPLISAHYGRTLFLSTPLPASPHPLHSPCPPLPSLSCPAVDHSIVMYLMGPDGQFIDFFTQLMTAPEIAEKISSKMAAREGVTKDVNPILRMLGLGGKK